MKATNKKLASVVIFGRTNVGKSTLFNRLTEKNQALVASIEGTTRDYNIGEVEWGRKKFELIDTGGIMDTKFLTTKKKKAESIDEEVQQKASQMLKKADLILFLVDSLTGLLPQDKQMAIMLKKIVPKQKHIILVANKSDSPKVAKEIAEFNKLALGLPVPVSASSGSGTGDLLDIIVQKIKSPKIAVPKKEEKENEKEKQEEKEERQTRVCIIGKPNVGKSSLLNSIIGEDRVIVSPIPHTTREPQDTKISYKNKDILLVDTAGISKKGQQVAYTKKQKKYDLEKQGIAKSIYSLNYTDIVLFVIDINEDITHQDAKIVEEIIARKKSLIIVANKWDLVPEKDTKKYTDYIYTKLPFVTWAPIQFVSAHTGEKVKKIMDLILEIAEQRKKEIADSQANTFLMKIIKRHKPAKGKGLKHPRIFNFSQVKSNPPKFEVRIGVKDNLHFSYVRFMENRLREKFGFLGTPISIRVTRNRAVHGKHEL